MTDQYKFNNDPKDIVVTDSWRSPVTVKPSIDLRDWFAGMAMQGILSSGRYDWGCKSYADESYSIADEMLKAREKK
jgi:hypothetical protein